MKNQYVGDIGDYGKYGMLREFIKYGISVGVNWYLTIKDMSHDGKFTDYLKKKPELREYDEELFEALKGIAPRSNKTVHDIEKSGILPGAVFYSEYLRQPKKADAREEKRNLWFEESMKVLKGTELIFLDPDNGILKTDSASKKGADKYVLPREVEKYFDSGKNVVYYCHKGRRTADKWEKYKELMFERIPEAKPLILTYHKGTQRSYVFLVHKEDYARYMRIIDGFLRKWDKSMFEEESLKIKA